MLFYEHLLFTLEEDRWCTVTLNKQKLKTKEMGVDVVWQDTVSLLVDSIQYDKVWIDWSYYVTLAISTVFLSLIMHLK